MLFAADCLVLICLACMVLQDFKYREISWLLIPLTFSAFIIKGLHAAAAADFVRNSLLNAAFIGTQLLALSIYMSIKNKRPVNIVNTYLGIGDILFFMVACVAFSTVNFIVFFVLSLMITLLGFAIYKLLKPATKKEIPLAGAMAFVLILITLTGRLLPAFNAYNDAYFLNIINRL